MSAAAAATLHPDEKYKAGKIGKKVFAGGLLGFAVLTLVAMFLERGAAPHTNQDESAGLSHFYYAYIVGWAFILSIALGALLFVLIHHIVKARWSTTTRRLAEILTSTLPIIMLAGLVFVVPIVLGNENIYFWGHHDAHFNAASKHTWFKPAFWTARYFAYFAIWILMARWYVKKSREQDETGDTKLSDQMRRFAGPGVIIYALSVCYAGFDFLMSLAPHWFSTIYSVNFFGGCMIAGYASISLFAWALQRTGRLTRSVTTEHYHDLGKMMFAFTFFWIYTAFSQFMLIWYANVAEETVFFNYRMFNDWQWWSWALLIGQWAIPFTFLLSRWTKRIMPVFVFFCVWQLVFHWVDLYWNVMPHYHWGSVVHGAAVHVTGPLSGPVSENHFYPGELAGDIFTWLGLVALFIGAVGRGMKGNLIPVKDPNLGASLKFENY